MLQIYGTTFWLAHTDQWWSLETWSRSRDVCRDPFFWDAVSEVSGLVSVSKDFGLGHELFVSRLWIGYFLWRFARSYSKKRFQKMIVQNLAVQRGQLLSFLCCYVVCEMQKTICPLLRLKFMLNSIKKCACTNETAMRILWNERLGVLC